MRIAIDSNVFTMQKYGGVSRYFVRLSEELMGLGNEVEVFGGLHTNRHLADTSRRLSRMHYVEAFPPFTRRLAHHAGDVMAGVALRQWKPDVIHESFCHARRVGPPGLPRVCTVHDMIHELFPQYWGRMDRTPEYRRKTIARCGAVICVSESTRKDLLDLVDVDPGKVHVIHHGFEHVGTAEAPSSAENAMLAKLVGDPYLLYVGARHSYKNFEGFLRGLVKAGLHREVRVIAFGGGSLTPHEMALIRSLGFPEGQIVQLGGSDSMLRALFREARAFVYPSLYEGFGFPPLEAMAQSCPVISSNASSMPEVIGDAAEFFDPTDTESMALAILSVVNSRGRREELIELGHRRLAIFSWKKCAKETLAIYQIVK